MTINELLVERGLTTALILDDAYDAVPRAEDLGGDDEAWANFVDDIRLHREKILSAFPGYATMDGPSLRASDEFVAAIWGLRDELPRELWSPLFDVYEQGSQTDRAFLSQLESALTGLGLTLITGGREVPVSGNNATIIFADLFLGAAQQDPDMERSLLRLRQLLAGRAGDPPLVILMSRSNLLGDKKAYFRDSAGLLGTMFRVYSKHDLLDGSTLVGMLERLATHRPDAIRVSELIRAWEEGLNAAAARFMSVIRRLDLSDYAQIRQLLLEFEGQPLGSYLLDVFDRVLQHEIEGDEATIRAATALNSIDPQQYPAPYIAGSSDLQELAYRSIWQHPRRLAVTSSEAGAPVSFGDVLVRRSLLEESGASSSTAPEADALAVLTASCDLVRGGAKRVMLMAGKLADLTPKTWTYKGGALKTPILRLQNDLRVWVAWDVKDVRTMLPGEVGTLTVEGGPYVISHRLREGYALELQQRLLADIGRVGVLAPMPATFPVTITFSTVDAAGQVRVLNTPIAQRDGGVCFTGRDADGNENTRLVVTEALVDELQSEIAKLDETSTYERTRDTLRRLKVSSLVSDLQRGLKAPSAGQLSWREIRAGVKSENGAEVDAVVGLIARNPTSPPTQLKHGALILTLRDNELEAAAAKALSEMSRDDQPQAAAVSDEGGRAPLGSSGTMHSDG